MASNQGVRTVLSAVLLFSAIAFSAADLWGSVLTEPLKGLYKIDLANMYSNVNVNGLNIVTDFSKYPGFNCNGQKTYVCINGPQGKRAFTGTSQANLQILSTETTSQKFVFYLGGGDQTGCAGFERRIKFVFDYDINAGPASFVSATQTATCSYTLNYKTSQVLASITDDPHYEGFQGQEYDVQGTDGVWFSLLSDIDLEVNGYYDHLPDTKAASNNILAVGIKYKGHRISFDSRSNRIVVDDTHWHRITRMEQPDPYVLRDSQGNFIAILTRQYNRFFKLETPNHLIYVDAKLLITEDGQTHVDEAYFNLEFAVTDANRSPHGLLGQTAHRMDATKSTDEQGVGVIDGKSLDYVVDGKYSHSFKYNKYNYVGTA